MKYTKKNTSSGALVNDGRHDHESHKNMLRYFTLKIIKKKKKKKMFNFLQVSIFI